MDLDSPKNIETIDLFKKTSDRFFKDLTGEICQDVVTLRTESKQPTGKSASSIFKTYSDINLVDEFMNVSV